MSNYDSLAQSYAPNRDINPTLFTRLITTVVLDESSTVLEVGCGTGNYIGKVAKVCGSRCWGIDPSMAMLAAAQERQPAAHFQRGSGGALPFDSDCFDFVYSVDVIHHMTEIFAYFGEAQRVLKPGGWICTATDSADDIRGRRPLSTYFPETLPVELARYPTIEQLRIGMEESGFTNVELNDIQFSYPLTDLEPYRQRAFSCLHLIDDPAFQRGIRRMEAELADGPLEGVSRYTLLWGMA